MTNRLFYIKPVLFIFIGHGESWVRTKGQRPRRPSGLPGGDVLALLPCSAQGGGWEMNSDTRAKGESLRAVDLDKH